MLLPSDVARLVLGYLQEEGLSATSQTFIQESPNLKEYAEHSTTDGTIPACVFSIFGKSLTTILNEYMAAKAKERCHEVPAMMTSLWKKLDFTLNQIKSLQNSPAISACQRIRSRVGVANMARQRSLALAPAGGAVASTATETVSIINPMQTSHSVLTHSAPVSCTAPHSRPAPSSTIHLQIQEGARLQNMSRECPVQITFSDNRLNPGPLSPGRRKWDTPKKRCRVLSGSGGTGKSTVTVSGLVAEPQPEEVIEENFPQLVIQNARDKILGDRSLQEKLAENINKILANEPTPQTKASLSAMEPDQSIDEILGLQGEIHMSDDAIHDILEQTESDPAFQALFDLFDYNKNKFTETEAEDGVITSISEESDDAGPSLTVKSPQNTDTGETHKMADSSDTTLLTGNMKAGQERKTRKSAAPSNSKKVFICSSGRASRIENSTAKLLVTHEEYKGVASPAGASKTKETSSLCTTSVEQTQVQIELLNAPLPPDNRASQEELKCVTMDSTSVSLPHTEPISTSFTTVAPQITVTSNVDKIALSKQAQGGEGQLASAPCSSLRDQTNLSSANPFEPKTAQTLSLDLVHMTESDATSGEVTESVPNLLMTSAESISPTSTSANDKVVGMPTSVSSLGTTSLLTSSVKPKPLAPSSSTTSSATSVSTCATVTGATVTVAPDPLTNNCSAMNKSTGDSDGSIVSLKIIISDNQDEHSSSNQPLNQAASNVSGAKIPTIYLNSPVKSPGVPGIQKPKLDETAQAISNLQGSEALQLGVSELNPAIKRTGASSPFTGSPAQPSYIIQVPLDTTNPVLQGTTTSYFLVTEPLTPDPPTKQVLVPTGISNGQPLLTGHCGVRTPPHSQCASTALILQSPVQPVMLPVSVMGNNSLGNVQVVSNTLVAMSNPAPLQQSKTIHAKPQMLTDKQTPSGLPQTTEQNLNSKGGQSLSPEDARQPIGPKGPSSAHRRILSFESSEVVKPHMAESKITMINKTPLVKSTAPSAQNAKKNTSQLVPRTKPTILGGNKPKRRITTVRCSENGQSSFGEVKETNKVIPPPQNQNNPTQTNPHKEATNDYGQELQSESSSSENALQLEPPSTSIQSQGVNCENLHKKGDKSKGKDSALPGSLTSDSVQKSGSQKEDCRKDPPKSHEGCIEKRNPSELLANVTANKENEVTGSLHDQQHQSISSSLPRDLNAAAAALTTCNLQLKSAKDNSKTSSLAKQAAEMLQDIQGLNSPSTPVSRSEGGSSELTLPQTPVTGSSQTSVDCPRTPATQRKNKPREGTPKHLMPPNTPEIASCSPSSEAGSENSISMAAHTLMILSRAAIARTGTPLKDRLRQDGAGKKTLTAAKNSRKRKLSCPTDSPPAKKESKRSPSSKKKDKERKKVFDCFPLDLDVDKFLSSLHYDE